MDVSFEEKSVWIQLVSMVVVLGGYFVVAGMMMSRGIVELGAYVPLFIVTVVAMVVVIVVGHAGAAIVGVLTGNRPEDADERDRVIGWRAESNSSWVLATGVLCGITGMVLKVQPVWIAHLLLGSMFLSEVLRFVLQIVYYRRGM